MATRLKKPALRRPRAARKPERPTVTAAFALSWDGRMLERRTIEGAEAVICEGDGDMCHTAYRSRGDDASPLVEAHGPLRRTLEHLRARHGVRRVGFAGGPRLLRELASGGMLDELRLAWQPRILGGKAAPPITGLDGDFLPRGIVLDLAKLHRRDGECVATYRVHAGGQ